MEFSLRVRVKEGSEEDFLERYGALRARIEQGLDGHVVHRLSRGLDEPDRWLMTSQWESLEAAQEWERSPEHAELTLPLRECWSEAERSGYEVQTETRRA